MDVFTKEFVTAVHDATAKLASEQDVVTRAQVLEGLGLDSVYAPLISLLVANGLLEGFELKRGRFGGLKRVKTAEEREAEAEAKKAEAKAKRAAERAVLAAHAAEVAAAQAAAAQEAPEAEATEAAE